VNVGRRARLRRAIVDKNVDIPEGYQIGFDREADRKAGLTVLEAEDLVVVPKGHPLRAP
jgi:glucose-1-phosphate adenylyltransferase